MRQLFLISFFASCACAQTASIEGIITSSVTGSPLSRVHVVLKDPGDNSGAQYGAETTDAGKFSITGVAATRSYILSAERGGFATGRISLTLQKDEERNDIQVKLRPTGAITGRITDYMGEPVEHAEVTAEGWLNKQVTTDENGRFRIGGLAPGRYRVRAVSDSVMYRGFLFKPEIQADGSALLRDAMTYYPGVTDPKQARRVEVTPGKESTGVDIQMVGVPVVRVSGKVADFPRDVRQAYASLSSRSMGGGSGFPIKPDGSFVFWGMDPGQYTVSAEWGMRDDERVSASLQVEVAGSNIDNIELRPILASDLNGHLLMESGNMPPSNGERKIELPMWGHNVGNSSSVDSDGTFHIPDVVASRYSVKPSWDSVYVKSTRLGTIESAGDVVDLSNGVGGAQLTVVLSTAVGSLSGIVHDEKDNPAEALVILARDRGEETLAVTKSTGAQPNGAYSFASVAPGRYKIIALPKDDADVALKPWGLAVFDDMMESVDVDPSGQVLLDLRRRDFDE